MIIYTNKKTELILTTSYSIYSKTLIFGAMLNIEGGHRYKPPGVSRGSPKLHCLLIISVL